MPTVLTQEEFQWNTLLKKKKKQKQKSAWDEGEDKPKRKPNRCSKLFHRITELKLKNNR